MAHQIFFGVIVDGTQDINGKEQESVCTRYIDDKFDIHETFIGLCEVSSTTRQALTDMLSQ